MAKDKLLWMCNNHMCGWIKDRLEGEAALIGACPNCKGERFIATNLTDYTYKYYPIVVSNKIIASVSRPTIQIREFA